MFAQNYKDMKTGQIQLIKHKTDKDWTNPQGVKIILHEYDVVVGDDIGVITYFGDQKVDSYGDKIEYEVTTDQYGTKIRKPKKEASGAGYQKGNTFDAKCAIMSYAKDLGVARVNNGPTKDVDIESVIKDYLKMYKAYMDPQSFEGHKKPTALRTDDFGPPPYDETKFVPEPVEGEPPSKTLHLDEVH